MQDMPEEDALLQSIRKKRVCEHEYVDAYGAWGQDSETKQVYVWVFCKRCLDKQLLVFDLAMIPEDVEE